MTTRFRAFTLVELLVVVVFLAIIIAVLLPLLSRARKSAMVSKMSSDWGSSSEYERAREAPSAAGETASTAAASLPLARVSAFEAQIDLTPRLSVGTAEAQSIYEAKFVGKIKAAARQGQAESRILFPLPPQIISLSDLTFKVNGEPSDAVEIAEGRLVWHGKLPAEATPIELTYSAVGKGVYALDIPPGGKLDTFKIDLSSMGSDVRMLELSLQPNTLSRSGGKTTYNWNYKDLVFGRPIALDVLGIAPIDRLGELSWLGPLSVLVFGLLLGLIARAYDVQRIDRWMLLLIIGTFTGAYPLMYFAQEFANPTVSIVLSALVVLDWASPRMVDTAGGLIKAGLERFGAHVA